MNIHQAFTRGRVRAWLPFLMLPLITIGASLSMISAADEAVEENLGQQASPVPFHTEVVALESGLQENQGESRAQAFSGEVRSPGAAWLRIRFAPPTNLGAESFVRVTSGLDGGTQDLDSAALQDWGNASAFFNGDAVAVELHVAPGESGVFFQITEIVVGDWVTEDSGSTQEICGVSDNRVSSNDPAVGRLMTVGCTGWNISNGGHLTAGHCAGANQVLQFNVPPSLANGTPVNPPPQDQYPVTYVGSTNGGLGNDWAVFRTGANGNGQFAIERQGAYYRMTIDHLPATVRETGFGIDGPPPLFGDGPRNSDSQTQQTHAGPFISETFGAPPSVTIRFQVDDENGNSGSPVINLSLVNNVTIGIATNAGCTSTGGSNGGTGFENNNLENAVQAFPGINVEYVDIGHPIAVENGTVFRPWNTVPEGINGATAGGVLSIVTGTYPGAATFPSTKPLTIRAPVGAVTIGP